MINKKQPSHHQTRVDKYPRYVPNILIVDDDVDSAVAVESIFRQFGCNVVFALDPLEAGRKMSKRKSDIIILDWMLDPIVSADEVVAEAIRHIRKFDSYTDQGNAIRPKIITYSSLDGLEINLPESPFYHHLDHWQKPLRPSELAQKTVNLLNSLGY